MPCWAHHPAGSRSRRRPRLQAPKTLRLRYGGAWRCLRHRWQRRRRRDTRQWTQPSARGTRVCQAMNEQGGVCRGCTVIQERYPRTCITVPSQRVHDCFLLTLAVLDLVARITARSRFTSASLPTLEHALHPSGRLVLVIPQISMIADTERGLARANRNLQPCRINKRNRIPPDIRINDRPRRAVVVARADFPRRINGLRGDEEDGPPAVEGIFPRGAFWLRARAGARPVAALL